MLVTRLKNALQRIRRKTIAQALPQSTWLAMETMEPRLLLSTGPVPSDGLTVAGFTDLDFGGRYFSTVPVLSGGVGGALGGEGNGYLEFNGMYEYAVFGSPKFDVGSAGTLSFWTSLDLLSKDHQFFEGPGDSELFGGNDPSMQFQCTTDYFVFQANGELSLDSVVGSTTGAPGQNVWFNVQYTWDINAGTNGEGHIYINGTEVTYHTGFGPDFIDFSTPVDTTSDLFMVGNDQSKLGLGLDGKLDDVAFYNIPLNQQQLDLIRTNGAASVTNNQVVHWAMDDAPLSLTAVDSSPNNINLILDPAGRHDLDLVSPTNTSPQAAETEEQITIDFDFTENGFGITDHVSVTDVTIDGVEVKGTLSQATENFSSLTGSIPNGTMLADEQLMVKIAGNSTLEVNENGEAVFTSPDEPDGITITSIQQLPSTYVTQVDVKVIDFEIDNTDRDENGFYWNAIVDKRPIGPAHNSWPHNARKIAIDIDNRYNGTTLVNHGVYILYYYGSEKWDNLFWNGSRWVEYWTPAFYYENEVWYHTEIEKNETHYVISVWERGGSLITRATVPVANVVGKNEDWFYSGEPHTNDYYTGQAAMDNFSVTKVDRDLSYNPVTKHWQLNITVPTEIAEGLHDVYIEAQYNPQEIVVSNTATESVLVRNLMPGDISGDGVVDTDDIEVFVAAVLQPDDFSSLYPDAVIDNGDVNGDGRLNTNDINSFVGLLASGAYSHPISQSSSTNTQPPVTDSPDQVANVQSDNTNTEPVPNNEQPDTEPAADALAQAQPISDTPDLSINTAPTFIPVGPHPPARLDSTDNHLRSKKRKAKWAHISPSMAAYFASTPLPQPSWNHIEKALASEPADEPHTTQTQPDQLTLNISPDVDVINEAS